MRLIAALKARSAGERILLVEALLLVTAAAAAIRARSFLAVVRFGAVPLGAARPIEPRAVTAAVLAVARRMPFRAKCFEQGLAVQRMLRRRGLDARLHYGIALAGGITAHVWVSLKGDIVHGGETASLYREVGQWP